MRTSITADILSVLNNNISLEDKRLALMAMQKKRRGDNRRLLYVICEMLSSYVLPLKHDETIRIITAGFTEKECIKLKSIISDSKCTYFNAVCGEALWAQEHDIEMAQKALLAYESELECPSINSEYIYTELTVGICRIYSRCKIQEFNFSNFFQKSIKYVKDNYDVSGYCILFVLNALLSCQENAEQIEEVFEDAISYYEQKKAFDRAIHFMEDLEEFYRNNKREKDAKYMRYRIAVNQEQSADTYDWECPEHAHTIVSLIQSAMNSWSQVDEKKYKSERQRLAKRIEPVKKLALSTLKEFHGEPIDISKLIESFRRFIEKATIESFVHQLSLIISLQSYESTKEELEKNNGLFSAGLFSSVILDDDGRKKCIIPSTINASKVDMTNILEHKASSSYAIYADVYIKNLLYLARKKFEFTEDNLNFIVEENIFVPTNHKKTFLKGIVAGFNLDLITAMHLLMPQIEHSVRCIAQECGSVVYKTDRNGVEESLSMESILQLPKVIDCLDETFLFNLRLFYTSVYGFGMRNEICHGLRSDVELQSADCLAVWWFTLRICCMFSPILRERLSEQRNQKEKEKNNS